MMLQESVSPLLSSLLSSHSTHRVLHVPLAVPVHTQGEEQAGGHQQVLQHHQHEPPDAPVPAGPLSIRPPPPLHQCCTLTAQRVATHLLLFSSCVLLRVGGEMGGHARAQPSGRGRSETVTVPGAGWCASARCRFIKKRKEKREGEKPPTWRQSQSCFHQVLGAEGKNTRSRIFSLQFSYYNSDSLALLLCT